MTRSAIQGFFWRFTCYQHFILRACPSFYNKAAALGFLVMQNLIIACFSAFIAAFFATRSLIVSIVFAVFYCLTTHYIQRSLLRVGTRLPLKAVLFTTATLSIGIGSINGLFLIQGLINEYPMLVSRSNALLQYQGFIFCFMLPDNGDEAGHVLRSITIAALAFCSFLMVLPQFIVFSFRKEIYYRIKSVYEQNF